MTTNPPSQHLPPEEALRRHQAGDRSQEVLSSLTLAAWEAYHAPWEPPLEVHQMTAEQPDTPFPEEPLMPLTQDMLGAWVEKEGYMAFSHPTRGFLINFKFGLRSDRCIQMRLYVTGRDLDILGLHWQGDKRIEPERFVQALRLCNWWNNEYRWPRAMVDQEYRYTDADDDPAPSKEEVEARELTHSSHLVLDFQVCLPHGVHQKTLEGMIDSAVETSWTFWRKAHDEWGL